MTQQVHKRRPEKTNAGDPRHGLRQASRASGGRTRLLIVSMAIITVLAVAGCTSGTYPVDIFYEQHYQQSY